MNPAKISTHTVLVLTIAYYACMNPTTRTEFVLCSQIQSFKFCRSESLMMKKYVIDKYLDKIINL